jgi:drug/metabolite transporter (DMT)-like permease
MLLMLGGILGALAQFCTVHAYRLASCSKLASAAYVILIPSTAIDYFFYKKLPDMCAAAGLGLILCGSFVALRKSSKT